MREKIALALLLFFGFAVQNQGAFARGAGSRLLSAKYPYGILGNGFGILNETDLALNACDRRPIPFSNEPTPYQYWQCFEVAKSRLFCDGNGIDKSEKSHLTLLIFAGMREDGSHEYVPNRTMPLGACLEFVQDWKRLTAGEKHVCVSGAFSRQESDRSGHLAHYWEFDRFKTNKGCVSYFEGGCSLSYQLKQGCKLTEN